MFEIFSFSKSSISTVALISSSISSALFFLLDYPLVSFKEISNKIAITFGIKVLILVYRILINLY
jgi:hypothetical protein